MRAEVLALFAASGLVLDPLAVAAPAEGAVSAGAAYSASTRVESTPNQTLRYAISLTRSGTFWLVLPLPPYAGTSGLSIHAINIRGAKLESVRGGLVLRAKAPYAVSAGRRLWVMINGIQTPPASTPAVTITALSTGNAVRARGTTPALTFIRPPHACMSCLNGSRHLWPFVVRHRWFADHLRTDRSQRRPARARRHAIDARCRSRQ
jgi:hypothetical protein